MSVVEVARDQLSRLEAIEIARTGAPRKTIRPVVARRVGVAPGTLENLRRGRIKDPRQSLVEMGAVDARLAALRKTIGE